MAPGALRRRAVTIPAVVATGVALVILAPVLVPAAALADLVTAPRRRPALRGYGFALAYVAAELVGLGTALGLDLLHLGGRRDRAGWLAAHRRLQVWWLGFLYDAAHRLLNLRLDVSGDGALDTGPILVLGRHVSLVDSVVCAHLIGVRHGLELRFVLKQELLSDPVLDVVASRLPNHFVDRSGVDSAAQVAAVGALAVDPRPDTAVCIFPEGTRFNEAKRERALARLADGDPVIRERAGRLRHLLPPRPGGALAVLTTAPDLDVVVVGHVGFEGLDSFAGLWRSVPFRLPVRVIVRRYPRADVPAGDEERRRWILDRWLDLDDWIAAELSARSGR